MRNLMQGIVRSEGAYLSLSLIPITRNNCADQAVVLRSLMNLAHPVPILRPSAIKDDPGRPPVTRAPGSSAPLATPSQRPFEGSNGDCHHYRGKDRQICNVAQDTADPGSLE